MSDMTSRGERYLPEYSWTAKHKQVQSTPVNFSKAKEGFTLASILHPGSLFYYLDYEHDRHGYIFEHNIK